MNALAQALDRQHYLLTSRCLLLMRLLGATYADVNLLRTVENMFRHCFLRRRLRRALCVMRRAFSIGAESVRVHLE